MKKYGSFPHLALFLFSLIFCLAHSGCGRSVDRTAVKKTNSPPSASRASSVNMVKQDLSMAKRLRQRQPSEYIIGPEDVVEISVYGHDDLRMEATVSSTGKISYYLAGDIDAAGLTRFQLRDNIKNKLATYVKDPHVIVRISQYRSHKVFVLGEVRKPGVYRMRNDITLVEAISAAGGVGPDAYLSGAYVVRDGKILLINFYKLIEKGNTEENIPLTSGDVIYIPDDKEQRVFVLGEVNKQAAIRMRDRMSLFEAVAEAGGFTRDARKDSIVVMRGNLSEPEVMQINAEDMNLSANIVLERGDIIYVASTTFANVERIAVRISNILRPFLDVARGIILHDATVDVLEGDTRQPSVVVP
jgi:polysaccharide export outer membrane protein